MKLISSKQMIALGLTLLGSFLQAQEPVSLKTQGEKNSYAIGADMGRNLKGRGVEVEIEPLLQGMRDALAGRPLLLTDQELRDTLRAYQAGLRQKQSQVKGGPAGPAQENLEKGLAFMAQNKSKEGVVALPSGLQYKILKPGTGRKPALTDTVECHHRGLLIDGAEFNSTLRSGSPATLKVSEMIPAWKEVLPLMPVGSKWQLFAPPQLAFGEKGVADARGRVKVGPNATVIFEVELLSIK